MLFLRKTFQAFSCFCAPGVLRFFIARLRFWASSHQPFSGKSTSPWIVRCSKAKKPLRLIRDHHDHHDHHDPWHTANWSTRCFKMFQRMLQCALSVFLILGIPGTSLCLAGGKALAHHRCDKFFGNLLVQKGKRTSVYSHYTLVTLSACSAERSFSDPVLLLACLASQRFQHHKGKTWFKYGNMYQHVSTCSKRCFGSIQSQSCNANSPAPTMGRSESLRPARAAKTRDKQSVATSAGFDKACP